MDEMVQAVKEVGRLDRQACRSSMEQRFSDVAMAAAYERLYRGALA